MPKTKRTIFHIDVNNAFLSWTAVQRLKDGEFLDIREIPSAIAGESQSRRGIILAKSTPAKRFGIQTGEPTIKAKQKCPDLLCFPPDFPLYSRCSESMFQILQTYSDRVEQFSIDEGFLDYTGMEALFGQPLDAAKQIQQTIYQTLGFTVNIGISSNKLLAKMAGELEKPNKILTLYPEEIPEKLWTLPVEELFMVGRRTAPKLHKMGIRTIGELAHYPTALLTKEFQSYGMLLHAFANGIDDSSVATSDTQTTAKSIGNSTTIAYDVTDAQTAHRILLALSETVSLRLRQSNLCAQEIAVTIKTNDFIVHSHQKQLYNAIDCTNAVYAAAKDAFHAIWHGAPIRLLGVRAGKLCQEDCIQLSFLEQDWEKQRQADNAMDIIRMKYGKNAVQRSTFIGECEKAYEGGKLKINNRIL